MKHKYEKPRSIDLGEYNSLMQAKGWCWAGGVAQGLPGGADCDPFGSIASGTGCWNGDSQSKGASGCVTGNSPTNYQCITGKLNATTP